MRSLTRSVGGLLTTTLVAAAPSSAAADSTAPDGTACPHASTRQPQLDLGAFERSVKCLINHERRRRDRVSLRDDGALDRAARRHAQDMVRRQYFAHVSPGGSRMVDRLRRAGYATLQRTGRGWSAAEVIAWGVATRSTARATVDAWMRSEPHRAALLNPDLRESEPAPPPAPRTATTPTASPPRWNSAVPTDTAASPCTEVRNS